MYPLVAARASYRCEYCHAPQRGVGYRLELDHIVPTSRGGSNDIGNIALACSPCNQVKGARTHATDPHTGRRVPLFNPRRHYWDDHFRWSASYRSIIGRTDVGRATVRALRMNDRYRRHSREFWHEAGLIP